MLTRLSTSLQGGNRDRGKDLWGLTSLLERLLVRSLVSLWDFPAIALLEIGELGTVLTSVIGITTAPTSVELRIR